MRLSVLAAGMSALLAFAAAALWLWSVRVKVPTGAWKVFLSGGAVMPENQREALAKQNSLSAWAAILTGLSALASAASTWLQTMGQ